MTLLVMWIGFILAAYSVVGNDVIQTLGTFLSSNEKKHAWWKLWLFASLVLVFCLVVGYFDLFGSGDKYPIAYGRLDKFDMPEHFPWYYLLPPILLMVLTYYGVPVSTTFMILTLFSLHKLDDTPANIISGVFDSSTMMGKMIVKSFTGYAFAFIVGLLIYLGVSKFTEEKFINNPLTAVKEKFWTVAQWFTTAFLWYQWLVQDLANIYIYLKGGAGLNIIGFLFSLVILVGLLGIIFYLKGGRVQEVIKSKTNSTDIRSATFIDLFYAFFLLMFQDNYFGLWEGKIPMSTTWVFVGLLAGRELAIQLISNKKIGAGAWKSIFSDLGKVFFGLLVSVAIVVFIKVLSTM